MLSRSLRHIRGYCCTGRGYNCVFSVYLSVKYVNNSCDSITSVSLEVTQASVIYSNKLVNRLLVVSVLVPVFKIFMLLYFVLRSWLKCVNEILYFTHKRPCKPNTHLKHALLSLRDCFGSYKYLCEVFLSLKFRASFLLIRRVCKIAKSDYQFRHVCPSARPSVRPHAKPRLPLDGFW